MIATTKQFVAGGFGFVGGGSNVSGTNGVSNKTNSNGATMSSNGLNHSNCSSLDGSTESDARNAESSQALPSLPTSDMIQQMITPKIADEILAQTMNQLSIQERQQVYEDVHGVSPDIQETTELVDKCLQSMTMEIQSLLAATIATVSGGGTGIGKPSALQLALQQDYDYVMDLRIMFLRSEMYNVKKATTRMFGYFELKLEMFGLDKLGRDILQSDFIDPIDREYLEQGMYQLLPGKDSTGRSIMFSAVEEKKRSDNIPPENKLKALWYLTMKMLRRDVDTQKRGIVSIGYDCETRKSFSMQEQIYVWKSCRLMNVLPFRIVSMHYCYSDPVVHALIALGTTALGATTRARIRPHYGAHLEIMYELMTYGILPDMLPLQPVDGVGGHCDYVLSLSNHKAFLERLREEEEQELRQLQTLNPANTFLSSHPSVSPLSSSTDYPIEKLSLTRLERRSNASRPTSQPATSQCVVANNDTTTGRLKRKPTNINNLDVSSSSTATTVSSLSCAESAFQEFNNEVRQQPRQLAQAVDNGRVTPTDLDVLLGRGRRPQSHPGNMRFHKVMEDFEQQYETEDKFGKTVLAEMIVNTIKKNGGRFLRQNEVDWVVVTDAIARTRVSHGFRNLRIKRGSQSNNCSATGDDSTYGKSIDKVNESTTASGGSSILSTPNVCDDDSNRCGLFTNCNKRHKVS